jgi:hypothetical protein
VAELKIHPDSYKLLGFKPEDLIPPKDLEEQLAVEEVPTSSLENEFNATDPLAILAESGLQVLRPFANVGSIPASIGKSAIKGYQEAPTKEGEMLGNTGEALKGAYRGAKEQIGNVIEDPFYGAEKAPSGSEITGNPFMGAALDFGMDVVGGMGLGAAGAGIKTLSRAEKVKALGASLKGSLPYRAGVQLGKQSGATEFAGGAIDAIPELYPPSKAIQSIGKKNSKRILSKYSKEVGSKASARLDQINDRLWELGLQKYIANPKKLLSKIDGEYINKKFPNSADQASQSVKIKEGFSDVFKNRVDEILVDSKAVVPKSRIQMAEEIENYLSANRAMPTSAAPLEPERMAEIVDAVLKPATNPEASIDSVKVLNDLRRSNNDFIYSSIPKTGDAVSALEKETRGYISKYLGDQIEMSLYAKSPQLAREYRINNAKLADLIELRELVESELKKQIKSDTTAEKLMGAAIGGTSGTVVGSILGNPIAGGLVGATGGLYHNAIGRGLGRGLPSAMTRGASALAPVADTLTSAAGTAMKQASYPSITSESIRGPLTRSGLRTIQDYMNQPEGISEIDIIKTPLPRTTKAILENKEFVKAKIHMYAPQMESIVADTLDNDPDAIAGLLPVIMMQFPQIFQRDPYNRVDGKIMDPNLKAKARKDILQNKDYSSGEKAKRLSDLNESGYLED